MKGRQEETNKVFEIMETLSRRLMFVSHNKVKKVEFFAMSEDVVCSNAQSSPL